MMNRVLTVILPIYNVEKYIEECLDSLVAQTCQDFEVLLVDDGSTDSSGKICDRYASAHPNFRVIHKPNGGVASARNIGLKETTTRYVTFIDSDDFVAPDFLASLMAPILSDSDINFVQAGCLKYYAPSRPTEVCQQYDYYCGDDKLKVFNEFRGLTFSKVFDNEILRSHAITFDPLLFVAEDYVFTLQYLLHVRKYCFLPLTGYYYRTVAGSLSSKFEPDYGKNKHLVLAKYDAMNAYLIRYNIPVSASTKCAPQVASDLSCLLFILYHSPQQHRRREFLSLIGHCRPILGLLPWRQRFFSRMAFVCPICGDLLLFFIYRFENRIRRFRQK